DNRLPVLEPGVGAGGLVERGLRPAVVFVGLGAPVGDGGVVRESHCGVSCFCGGCGVFAAAQSRAPLLVLTSMRRCRRWARRVRSTAAACAVKWSTSSWIVMRTASPVVLESSGAN